MSLEKQLDDHPIKQEPIITDDEANFIAESGQMPLYVEGMLSIVRRTGQTLEEIYNQAISEPGNEEHIPAVKQARDFLAKNSDRFGLTVSTDESI